MTEPAPRTYYFVGIGGLGMSALAQLLVARGDVVLGSDLSVSPTTDLLREKGIDVSIGQRKENIPEGVDMLVYSDAVSEDHEERSAGRERGIPEHSYFQLLGEISAGFRTVAVAGTHGKTTTTGMLAKILHDVGISPNAIVGSIVQDFGSNYLPGTSDLFIVEACEYRDHLLELSPEILIITNLEWDHTDYFPDLAALQATFKQAIDQVPVHGTIVTDPELPGIQPLLEGVVAKVVDYTQEPAFALRLPGGFNQDNARAAAAAARCIDPSLTDEVIAHALADFRGTWRRFEYKGKTAHGIDVLDDYAHHPTAITETLRALRARLDTSGGGRIIVAFHPHLYSRTRDLLDGFARAFTDADEVILAPIFPAREIDDGTISSELLAERIRAEGVSARAVARMEDVVPMIQGLLRPGSEDTPPDTLILMGAGNIYTLAKDLVAYPV